MKRITICVLLLACSIASSEDIYVAQSATGGDTGADSSNCKSLSWLNTSGNWGSGAGKVSAGDTVRLVGTFTNALTVQGNGSAGSPITVYFEPGAKFSAPSWPVSWWGGGAISLSAKHYITIDGGSNGLIIATDNGTDRALQDECGGVGAASSSHLLVKNLTITDLYVRTGTNETAGSGYGIGNVCTVAPYSITNFTVTNCVISNVMIGIESDYGPDCTNYTFIGNTASGVNWGGRCGDRNGSSSMRGLVVANNWFHTFTNWNDTSIFYHHNGFYGWAESGGFLGDVQFYGNKVGPGFGNQYSTSGVFFSGVVSNILIFNNLFVANSGEYVGNGFITVGPDSGLGGPRIFNNTLIGGGVGRGISTGTGDGTHYISNNIIASFDTAIFVNYAASVTVSSDRNLFYDLTAGQEFSKSTTGTASFLTLAGWQALGYDSNCVSADHSLDSGYVPSSGSPAIGAGTDLSSVFTTDRAGSTRSFPWDIGAYETSGGGPVLLVLTEPTARGLAGDALERVIREDRRAGWTVYVREVPRWTGTWATNDWRLLNIMSNEVRRFCTTTNDAVVLFGKLPFLQTGGQNDDGHYLRRVATDGWLGCSSLTFTDTDDWMALGMNSADIMASNRVADGFPDNMNGTLFVPVTRVDASDMGALPTNYVFASGYLAGQVYQPAINEGYWLRNYLTNVWKYQTRQWTVTETGFIDNGASAWSIGSSGVQSANSAITWTASTDSSAIAGGTWRFVYDANWPEVFSPYMITSGGTPLRAFWIVSYKSYEMEIWDSSRHPLRRLFPGVINQPFSLVASWCRGNQASPYFRSRASDSTVFDVIRSSAAGTVDFRYNVYGWGTLLVDQPTATPLGQATANVLTITE